MFLNSNLRNSIIYIVLALYVCWVDTVCYVIQVVKSGASAEDTCAVNVWVLACKD